ncbi:MAG: hypothetical protein ACK5X3_08375, partial [Pseudomonadota bacterium]
MPATADRLTALATSWHQDAETRRRMSAGDVGADILDYCARALTETLREAADDDEELSVAAVAVLPYRPAPPARPTSTGTARTHRYGWARRPIPADLQKASWPD